MKIVKKNKEKRLGNDTVGNSTYAAVFAVRTLTAFTQKLKKKKNDT